MFRLSVLKASDLKMHETRTYRKRRVRVLPFVFATVLAMAGASYASGPAAQPDTTPVKVPDAVTAVNIAEKALTKVYGKKRIDSQRSFNASLSDGVWHVSGTLYCKDRTGNLITNNVSRCGSPSRCTISLYEPPIRSAI